MNPMPMTADDVTMLLGEVDATLVARLIATGASAAELGEAVRAFDDATGVTKEAQPPSTDRVAEVRAVLDELWTAQAMDDDDEH